MRNIQNRQKRIKYKRMKTSFIIARLYRKMKKFSENAPSGSWVSDLRPHLWGSGSHLWDGSQISGLGSWVLSTVPGLGSYFSDMLCYSSFDIEIYFSYKSSINSHQSYFFLRVANFEAFLIKMLKSDSHPPKKLFIMLQW